jgi:PiT family inorganic phosphate transporter
MTDIALPGSIEPARKGPDLSGAINPITGIIFGGIVAAVLLFVAYSIYSDVDAAGTKATNYLPFLLLFVALLIALGFEFVNGFHDTANAVATVIYTRALPANIAVVWSGVWNLAGVLASSGAVAFGIISLLPVELILQVGSHAGFAMVFALLIAAIIWNLGTWSFGLPASSSHTLIGSITASASPTRCCTAAAARRGSIGGKRRRSAKRCCSLRCSGSRSPPLCCCC